jgi:hypothetical protein
VGKPALGHIHWALELSRAGKREVHEDYTHPYSVEVKTRGALPPFRIYPDVKVHCFVTHNILDTGHKRERDNRVLME